MGLPECQRQRFQEIPQPSIAAERKEYRFFLGCKEELQRRINDFKNQPAIENWIRDCSKAEGLLLSDKKIHGIVDLLFMSATYEGKKILQRFNAELLD